MRTTRLSVHQVASAGQLLPPPLERSWLLKTNCGRIAFADRAGCCKLFNDRPPAILIHSHNIVQPEVEACM